MPRSSSVKTSKKLSTLVCDAREPIALPRSSSVKTSKKLSTLVCDAREPMALPRSSSVKTSKKLSTLVWDARVDTATSRFGRSSSASVFTRSSTLSCEAREKTACHRSAIMGSASTGGYMGFGSPGSCASSCVIPKRSNSSSRSGSEPILSLISFCFWLTFWMSDDMSPICWDIPGIAPVSFIIHWRLSV